MTAPSELGPYDPQSLPRAIVRYLEAQADPHSRRLVADAFAADARVVDEGIAHSGIDAIRTWLETAASEYSYTTTFTGQHRDGDRIVVGARLEGDFPGGVADVRFRFRARDERITDLVIAP